MGTKQQKRNNQAKFGVHVLVVIFGITSWSIMNGLWVELPILVSHLPEGWTLPSYLTIITQFGNIGLIVFSLLAYFKPKTKLETPASFVIVTALTLCSLLYAFFWKETAYVAGDDYSVALLGLTFSQSVFAATTSIAYVTFMAHLKEFYMASIFIGMGFSGLIPAFAALGQGMGNVRCVHSLNASSAATNGTNGLPPSAGVLAVLQTNGTNSTKGLVNDTVTAVNEEPPFSVQEFFLMLFGIGLISILSLLMLIFHPYCKTEHVDSDKEENCQLMQAHSHQESPDLAKKDTKRRFTGSTPQTSNNDTVISVNVEHVPDGFIPLKEINGAGNTPGNIEGTSNSLASRSDVATATAAFDIDKSSKSLSQIIQEPADPKNTDLKLADHMSQEDNETLGSNGVAKDVESDETDEKNLGPGRQMTKLESWYLLGLLVWINALQTSFVLAIQVYSSLPYGLLFYHGATKAENIVDPIASFLTFWIAAETTLAISGLTLLGTLFISYIVTVAAMSPNPFLVNETSGGVLVITAWVMCTLLMVFAKVSIAKVMRSQGRLSLMWTGASTQLGSMIGAVLAYVLINGLHLFKDEPWCRDSSS